MSEIDVVLNSFLVFYIDPSELGGDIVTSNSRRSPVCMNIVNI